MMEVFKRNIRIDAPKGYKVGCFVRIIDAETGEFIPGITSATIYIKPNDIVTAELTYYEINETGHIICKDDAPVEHTVTIENPEIDLPAVERAHAHIGAYDITFQGCSTPGKTYAFLNIEDEARNGVQFSPDEALALLKWLQQERPALEQLAQTCNAERRHV